MNLPIRSACRRSLMLLATALLIGGCALLDNNGDLLPPAHADFGDAYTILIPPIDPVSDYSAPHLKGDSLIVYVQYSGGCAPHDFDLRRQRTGQVLDLWFRHNANGDLCEALGRKRLARAVEDRQDARVIRLLVPGSEPIVLAEEG